ncbi:hypothetical protein ABEB36_005865 [Hypothenemus hampei]|uniref:Uncharacterized protein n=1 Tax=Hypothenemus hampei TaxID=57062 RepID=A0ABD1EZN8_HYPHA
MSLLALLLDVESKYDDVNLYILQEKLVNIRIKEEYVIVISKILEHKVFFSKNQDGKLIESAARNTVWFFIRTVAACMKRQTTSMVPGLSSTSIYTNINYHLWLISARPLDSQKEKTTDLFYNLY